MRKRQHHHSAAVLITVNEDCIGAAVAVQFKGQFRNLMQDDPVRVVLELSGLVSTVEKDFRVTRMETVSATHISVATAAYGLLHAS